MTESIRPWMQLAKKGDEQARQYVLEECQPLIQNLAEQHWKYHFRSYYDYHEVVNIAYLGICECIHDYDCTAKIPVTKLIEENINKLLNHDIYERHKYYDSSMVKTFENDGEATDLPLDVPDNKIMGPMEQVIYHEVREALFSALAKMAEKEKRAFALHYFKGKSIGEIAKLPGWQKGRKDRHTDLHCVGKPVRQRFILPSMQHMTQRAMAGGADYRKPDTDSQTKWLTDCFFAFRNALGGDQ